MTDGLASRAGQAGGDPPDPVLAPFARTAHALAFARNGRTLVWATARAVRLFGADGAVPAATAEAIRRIVRQIGGSAGATLADLPLPGIEAPVAAACRLMTLADGDDVLVAVPLSPLPEAAAEEAEPGLSEAPAAPVEDAVPGQAEIVAPAELPEEAPAAPTFAVTMPIETPSTEQPAAAMAPDEAAFQAPATIAADRPAPGEAAPLAPDEPTFEAPAAAAAPPSTETQAEAPQAAPTIVSVEPASPVARSAEAPPAEVALAATAAAAGIGPVPVVEPATASAGPVPAEPADTASPSASPAPVAPAAEPIASAPAQPSEAPEEPGAHPPAAAAPRLTREALLARAEGRGVIRFLWQSDAADRIGRVSGELTRIVGAEAAAIEGKTVAEAFTPLAGASEDALAAALTRRQTVNAVRLAWPVQDSALAVPVDLSALPVFDAARAFQGYRGFGLIRATEAEERAEEETPPAASPAPVVAEADAGAGIEALAEDEKASDAPPASGSPSPAAAEPARPAPPPALALHPTGGSPRSEGAPPAPAPDEGDDADETWVAAAPPPNVWSVAGKPGEGPDDASDEEPGEIASTLEPPAADPAPIPPKTVADAAIQAGETGDTSARQIHDAPIAPMALAEVATPAIEVIEADAAPLDIATLEPPKAVAQVATPAAEIAETNASPPDSAAPVPPRAVEADAEAEEITGASASPPDHAVPVPPTAVAEAADRAAVPPEATAKPPIDGPTPALLEAAAEVATLAGAIAENGAVAIPRESGAEAGKPVQAASESTGEAPATGRADTTGIVAEHHHLPPPGALEVTGDAPAEAAPLAGPLDAAAPEHGAAETPAEAAPAAPPPGGAVAVPAAEPEVPAEPAVPAAGKPAPPPAARAVPPANAATAAPPPARETVESGGAVLPFTRAKSVDLPPDRQNVVPLRLGGPEAPAAGEPAAPALSSSERRAFRDIAKALGARVDGDDDPEARAPAEEAPKLEGGPARAVLADLSRAIAPAAPAAPPAAPVEPAAAPPDDDAMPAREMLERLPVGVIVSRAEKILYANRTILDLLDYDSVAQIEARGGLRMLFRSRSPDTAAEFAATSPVLLAARDGETIPVDARVQSLDWGRNAASLMTVRRSLEAEHAQKMRTAEMELRAREAELRELRSILDTATDGVLLLDENGRIQSMNRAAEALFGYDQKEVAGDPFTIVMAPESHAVALDYLEGLKSGGVRSVLNDGREIVGRVRQGGHSPLFMTLGRVSDTPERKFCAVLRDLTAWRKAEGELIDAKRAAERANAQKSDFLAKMSHEIRTPLNAIIGFAEVMMEGRFGPVGNERYKDYLKDIHASGEHVISLVNDLLDLSKIEAGRMELAFVSANVNDIVASSVGLIQPQAQRARIVVRTGLSTKLPPVVADERSLKQIVLNVLSNAVKFTDAGGQVIVSTTLTDHGEVVIRVRDTGIGMSEKEIGEALEPFRQLATTRRAGGTGLGLPLTKALIEANRGTLRITSAKREGTLVEIVFPPTRVLAE